MERLELKDIKQYTQRPLEGFGVEPKPPKFIIIPLTDLARTIVTDNPAFLRIQEKRKEEKLLRVYSPDELVGKAVHATYSLMLFLDRYPLTKKSFPEKHIRETVENKLLFQFPSFKKIQLETTSRFFIEEGENIWFRAGEGENERMAKIISLFDQVRTALLDQENHEEYVFEKKTSPSDKYDETWLKAWEDLRHNGLISLRHLDSFFTNHLSKFKIYGQSISSELSLIQRFYHDRSELLRVQVNGKPDLILAISAINPQTGRFQFSHWQVYDIKNKKRRYRQTQEYKVDRTQLWLNTRALARTSYQLLRQRKEGKAVSIEGAIPPTIPVEGFLVYAREDYEDTMIERVEFSSGEEKTNEHRLYKWLKWYRKDKGILF